MYQTADHRLRDSMDRAKISAGPTSAHHPFLIPLPHSLTHGPAHNHHGPFVQSSINIGTLRYTLINTVHYLAILGDERAVFIGISGVDQKNTNVSDKITRCLH